MNLILGSQKKSLDKAGLRYDKYEGKFSKCVFEKPKATRGSKNVMSVKKKEGIYPINA